MIMEISNKIAHVVNDENRFVSEVEQISVGIFESHFMISGDHPYLYENPEIGTHVSGTTFFEVSRQLMKAIGHLYYKVPIDSRFTLQKVEIEFNRWAQLKQLLKARIEVSRPNDVKPYGEYYFKISYYESSILLGVFSVAALALSSNAEKRLMRRQIEG